MCGILGIISQNRALSDYRSRFLGALNLLGHRGPDDRGIFESARTLLGHTRLAIIDPDCGIQPMCAADKSSVLIFNGEIVNYKSLRKELQAMGVSFVTASDTEVLLKAWQQWGESCLQKLEGFFSFAVFDSITKTVTLARDRLGMKPLYYAQKEDVFAFSSEIKALQRCIASGFEENNRHFNEFLIFGYVAGDETLHSGIKELPPGHVLITTGSVNKTRRYWYPVTGSEETGNESSTVDALDARIQETIKRWLISDVEVSSLLSGGVDSSLVTAIASRHIPNIQAFTAYSPQEPEEDERHLTNRLAHCTDITAVHLPISDAFISNRLIGLVEHYDEPTHDSNYLTLTALCEAIREQSDVKVVMTGEGSDEIFGGYLRYRTISEEYRKSNDSDVLAYAMNRVALPRLRLFAESTDISNNHRWSIVDELRSPNPVSRALELDQLTFLRPYLNRQDRVGMLFGLEIRAPFLDHHLVEYVNRLADDFKIRKDGGTNYYWHKYILRKVAQRHVDPEIVWNRRKYQFRGPMAESFYHGPLKQIFRDFFEPDAHPKLASYYSTKGILRLLDRHNPDENDGDQSNTLWRLLNLEIWLQDLGNRRKVIRDE